MMKQNLLAACDGNEGCPRKLQHCDTHKGDGEITINPADSQKNCELNMILSVWLPFLINSFEQITQRQNSF